MNQQEHTPFQPGTRVVLKKRIENPSEGLICDYGSVCVVAALLVNGQDLFRIRLINGREVALRESDFTARRLQARERGDGRGWAGP